MNAIQKEWNNNDNLHSIEFITTKVGVSVVSDNAGMIDVSSKDPSSLTNCVRLVKTAVENELIRRYGDLK